MLKKTINNDYLIAFKSKNVLAKNLLSVVKGEIQTLEKNLNVKDLSDEDVLKILTKMSKSVNETISLLSKKSNSDLALNAAKEELKIITSYLPKQMSKEEIYTRVSQLVNSGITNIGSIMKEFASLPADKKTVSETIKEIVK